MTKKIDQNWFIEERSRNLAVMHLTRRSDLNIREEPHEDWGLDFIVEIVKDESASLRIFGIEVKGAASAVTDDQANKILTPTMQQFRELDNFYFPVCVFFFTMADNQGRYAWVAEPVVTDDGKPKLERRDEAATAILDNEALKCLIDRVDRWYEALGEVLSADGQH